MRLCTIFNPTYCT